MRALKYLTAFQIPLSVWAALTLPGWWSFLAVVHVYGLVPLVDQMLPSSEKNMNEAEEEAARGDRLYDLLLVLLVPVQYALMGYYLYLMSAGSLTTLEMVGNSLSMSMASGVLGINLAHEFGHRVSRAERFLSKSLLLTTLNMHFIIEHNLGHHKRVATHDDPATGRFGENIYTFVPRSMVQSYFSAWQIERTRRAKRQLPFWSLRNEMIQMTLIQVAALGGVFWFGGWIAAVGYLAVSLLGQAQLEIINYVEHYGLTRRLREDGRFERVQAYHSWNSNHAFGRLILFELTRHSDHHYMASRPYQVLRHLEDAPQMPAGYPAMMLMSLIPPVWFRVMNPRAEATMQAHAG
ncbi:MAG: alkane 1-monooxygenase [Rhodothermales bacterium]|jgi:alkane 1-monooxygenase